MINSNRSLQVDEDMTLLMAEQAEFLADNSSNTKNLINFPINVTEDVKKILGDISVCSPHRAFDYSHKEKIKKLSGSLDIVDLKDAVTKSQVRSLRNMLTQIDKDFDLEQSDSTGTTLLMIAAQKSDEQILRLLLSAGCNPNAKQYVNGTTSLLHAISRGNYHHVYELLRYGADVNQIDNQDESPLLKAIGIESEKIISLLLRFGAHLNDEKLIESINNPEIKTMLESRLKDLTNIFETELQKTLKAYSLNWLKMIGPVCPLKIFFLGNNTTHNFDFKASLLPLAENELFVLFMGQVHLWDVDECSISFTTQSTVQHLLLNKTKLLHIENLPFAFFVLPINGLNNLIVNTFVAKKSIFKLVIAIYKCSIDL